MLDSPEAIVPYSVADYIAQVYHDAPCTNPSCTGSPACTPTGRQNLFGCDQHGVLGINEIGGSEPMLPWPPPSPAVPGVHDQPEVQPRRSSASSTSWSATPPTQDDIPAYLRAVLRRQDGEPAGFVCASPTALADLTAYGFLPVSASRGSPGEILASSRCGVSHWRYSHRTGPRRSAAAWKAAGRKSVRHLGIPQPCWVRGSRAAAMETATLTPSLAELRARLPAVSYPPQLPVSQRKDEIAAAIRDNQVVIVAGETGSGKTTQLPKICLELGRGVTGQIGHTQPRRIAARTVAERIAEELGTEIGAAVGYKVRFTDKSSDGTLVKVMTDGILLAEMQRDRQLRRYDTLIIDEAHERSLNIDFILGYLKRLLPTRPDLKVIITSATIDPERFSRALRGRAGDRGVRAHLPGRGALPAAGRPRPAPATSRRTRRRASATPSANCAPRAPGTSWSSSAASGRSGTPPTRWPTSRAWRTWRSCRCTPGCPRPSSTASSSRIAGRGWCWPPTSRRPR